MVFQMEIIYILTVTTVVFRYCSACPKSPATPPAIPPAVPPATPPATPPANPPAVPPSTPPATPPANPPAVPPSTPPATPPANPPAVPPAMPPAIPPPAGVTKIGACYSPMHNTEYIRGGTSPSYGLDDAMDLDFQQISQYFSLVRTFYSNQAGYDIIPHAADYGVMVYLGVYMTSESWYSRQRDAAVRAAVNYTDSVAAILLGNENLEPYGSWSVDDIIEKIEEIKDLIDDASPGLSSSIPFGTVQRITEWNDDSIYNETQRLAEYCDIIGVNIYPFYSSGYDDNDPTAKLQGQWEKMTAKYEASKVRVTETGFPSNGSDTPSSGVIPSLNGAMNYWAGVQDWSPSDYDGPLFWYTFYDRRPDDDTLTGDYKKHFGFFEYDRDTKDSSYPYSV